MFDGKYMAESLSSLTSRLLRPPSPQALLELLLLPCAVNALTEGLKGITRAAQSSLDLLAAEGQPFEQIARPNSRERDWGRKRRERGEVTDGRPRRGQTWPGCRAKVPPDLILDKTGNGV